MSLTQLDLAACLLAALEDITLWLANSRQGTDTMIHLYVALLGCEINKMNNDWAVNNYKCTWKHI